MPHEEQRERAAEALRARGVGSALFADRANVTWLVGFAPPPQVGANPFRGQPAYVWYADGRFTVLVHDAHEGDLAELAEAPDVSVVPYVGYTLERPIAIGDNLAEAFERVLRDAPPAGAVGIERDAVPERLAATLRDRAGATEPIDGLLAPLRRVKTEEELAKLREAFDLVAVGHRAARDAVVVGAREIDVWTEVTRAVERHAGRRVPLGNDCVSGRREGNVGGWPGERRIERHDSLLLDLGAAPRGYWSDSCATYYAGGPSDRQRELHDVVARTLEHALAVVRPGVRANAMDAELRLFLEREGHEPFPHHAGHGIGAALHEEPRLAPYDDTPLEAGMVILLEPGLYLPGETSVRLEHAVLVTPDGCERLTTHDTGIA